MASIKMLVGQGVSGQKEEEEVALVLSKVEPGKGNPCLQECIKASILMSPGGRTENKYPEVSLSFHSPTPMTFIGRSGSMRSICEVLWRI